MKRSAIETLLGAFVLAVAGFFLVFSYKTANVGTVDGYTVTADFAGTGGLKAGDDVTISGVKIGTVKSVALLPDSYLARVYMNVASGIKLPSDTVALISSESLLGGRYLALEPGAEDDALPDNGHVQFTQAPQNLEQLLGKFIFSVSENKDKGGQGGGEEAAKEVPAPTISPRVEDAPKREDAPAAVEAPAAVSGEEPAHP